MWNNPLSRRKFLERFFKAGLCSALGYPLVVEPNWIALEQVQVPVADLSAELNGLRIGLLTDFHRGIYVTESDIQKAVRLLQQEVPDIVLLAGDFVEGSARYAESCAAVLSQLRPTLGTFAVLGNHDYWTDAAQVRLALQKFNITVLINQTVELNWNKSRFYLIGLDDVWMGSPDIVKALKGVPDNELKILLVHEPDYADEIRKLPVRLPLQLSGHSHGGQVIFPLMGPPYLPYLGQVYPAGLRQVNGSNRLVYTSRGLGLTLPFRFNCRPEVTVLTLRHANPNKLSAYVR